MNELSEEKLQTINGGGINGTIINALARGINTILELGRSLGSAFRRAKEGKLCPY